MDDTNTGAEPWAPKEPPTLSGILGSCRAWVAEAKAAVREALVAGREDTLMSDFLFGMSVRNSLRAAGFTEQALGVGNLDDVWFELVKRAVLLDGPAP